MKASWIKYLVCLLVVATFIIAGEGLNRYIQEIRERTFNPHFFVVVFSMLIFYCGFGALIGIDYLLSERKKEGFWKLNVPKFLILGIPSLYLSLSYWIYYNNVSIIQYFATPLRWILIKDTKIVILAQIFLGYVLVSSFYKGSETRG